MVLIGNVSDWLRIQILYFPAGDAVLKTDEPLVLGGRTWLTELGP